MATFTLSGSGTHAITAGTGALHVHVTTLPTIRGAGRAEPTNYYDLGLLRLGDGTYWWPSIPIDAEFQLLGCPAGTLEIAYALFNGTQLSVVEVAGPNPLASQFADPTTTKGDLLARTASALDRFGVGANGDILTADSSTTSGLAWSAPAGGTQDLVLLDHQELGASNASIVLSALGGAGYRTLRILAATNNGTGSNSTVAINLRLNADTTDLHVADCNGADSPNRYSVAEILVFDFLKTDRWKATMGIGQNDTGASGNFAFARGASWQQTDAITSLTLHIASGTFQAGCHAELYALK